MKSFALPIFRLGVALLATSLVGVQAFIDPGYHLLYRREYCLDDGIINWQSLFHVGVIDRPVQWSFNELASRWAKQCEDTCKKAKSDEYTSDIGRFPGDPTLYIYCYDRAAVSKVTEAAKGLNQQIRDSGILGAFSTAYVS
ncbi:hypothetical protein IE81DRAFT_332096 [Ceraceosorus guamensis]|uniref:Uncharacterized protein n=1 Tax=Ceraceosorus guamensis TaxID=1522189 RepID=A0A316VU51_9BASI|nr:hypothetical protein IE81DRAFT_332096 [Ceraceosorus guamensis]PWN39781.1 hypothetical protein IE81DRAFT_332096 [Ceraceosorus guamensis]